MLRLTETQSAGEGVILRVEGRAVGLWVAELRQACERILSTGETLALDLSDLWFIDSDGVSLLRQLKERNVAVVNCPIFIAEQLKETCRATSDRSE